MISNFFPYDPSTSRYLLTNYTNATAETDHVGIYGPDGTVNVTILPDESVFTGLYATNGSINVVQGSGTGIYSPCGAYNVTI